MLRRRKLSAFYAIVPESLFKYKVHRALKVPNVVVFSYFTDVNRNGSVGACLLVGHVTEIVCTT